MDEQLGIDEEIRLMETPEGEAAATQLAAFRWPRRQVWWAACAGRNDDFA